MQLARQYNGLAIVWEHRFYGHSLPFPINEDTGLAPAGYNAYKYLTTEQALEDVVYFAEHFQPPGLDKYWKQLSPGKSPWVWMGGSYPGARAAFIRVRNPEIFYASWASSGPVQARENMATYNEQLYQDMTANCSADFKAAAEYMDNVLANGSEQNVTDTKGLLYLATNPSYIPLLANATEAQIQVAAKKQAAYNDFFAGYYLQTLITEDFQSFGFDETLLPYCNLMQQFDPTTIDQSSLKNLITTLFTDKDASPATQGGIAATYGSQAAYLALLYATYRYETPSLTGNSTSTGQSTAAADGMSWQWQTCYEYGFFQVANTSSPYDLISSYLDVPGWETNRCQQMFQYPQLPPSPDVSAPLKYGGWKMNPSNVMFTDGLKDPWHTLSVQSTNSEIGAPNRVTTQDIPACNKPPANHNVFGLLYPEGYHASDLVGNRTTAPAEGLALFTKALDTWFLCFKEHSTSSDNSTTHKSPSSTSSASSLVSASSTASSSAPASTGGAANNAVGWTMVSVLAVAWALV